MTDSERLKEIKKSFQNAFTMIEKSDGKIELFEDMNWLIEQAEQLEKIKKLSKTEGLPLSTFAYETLRIVEEK